MPSAILANRLMTKRTQINMFTVLRKKDNLIFFASSILFFAVALLTVHLTTNFFVEKEVEEVERGVEKHLALVRANFEANIFMDTYLADSLATVITIDENFAADNWESLTKTLISKTKYVRHVGIAPDNIISFVYPIGENKGLIGLDYRSNPKQLETVLIAKAQQELYLSGPVTLMQGNTALIARYPIFSDYPKNQQYWGVVSVVMDYDRLIADVGITDFEGATIALRKLSSDGTAGEVFWGDEQTFFEPDAEYTIQIPSGAWSLAAQFDATEAENITFTKRVTIIAGTITTLLIYAFLVLHFQHYKSVHKASLHDELTHLPNRRLILSHLEKLMSNSANPSSFTLLNIDLNHFKHVNDQLGHDAGDELLKHVARELKKNVSRHDMVGRFGGDEFVVVMQNTSDVTVIEKRVFQIHHAIEAQHLKWKENTIQASLSIGYAVYFGQYSCVKDLLSDADKSMYENKHTQRTQHSPQDFCI